MVNIRHPRDPAYVYCLIFAGNSPPWHEIDYNQQGLGTGNLRGEAKTRPRKPQKRGPGSARPRTGHGEGWKKKDPPPGPAARCGAGIFCGAPENPGPRVPRSEHYSGSPLSLAVFRMSAGTPANLEVLYRTLDSGVAYRQALILSLRRTVCFQSLYSSQSEPSKMGASV